MAPSHRESIVMPMRGLILTLFLLLSCGLWAPSVSALTLTWQPPQAPTVERGTAAALTRTVVDLDASVLSNVLEGFGLAMTYNLLMLQAAGATLSAVLGVLGTRTAVVSRQAR